MELTEEQTLDVIASTIVWGRDVAEMWTGTLYGKEIDLAVDQLIESQESGDIAKAKSQAFDLAQFLDQAEREYERADELQKSR